MTREELKKYKLILELLEQEPCENCVSREAVIDLVADYDLSMDQVVKGIHALPPVIPSRPKGTWIDDNCSICGYGVNPWNKTPYCPNCGAKMTESEGKI